MPIADIERMKELDEDIFALCEAYSDLAATDVGHSLIAYATRIMLRTSSNHLDVMEDIMASVMVGIGDYQVEKQLYKAKPKGETHEA